MKNTFSHRFSQGVVAIAGMLYLLTGIALLFAPIWFFQHVGTFPPFNQHYEGDLGSFLAPLGIGLLVAAREPGKHAWLLWVAAIGSLLHAGNHLYDAFLYPTPVSEWFAQIVPLLVLALLLLVIAQRSSYQERKG